MWVALQAGFIREILDDPPHVGLVRGGGFAPGDGIACRLDVCDDLGDARDRLAQRLLESRGLGVRGIQAQFVAHFQVQLDRVAALAQVVDADAVGAQPVSRSQQAHRSDPALVIRPHRLHLDDHVGARQNLPHGGLGRGGDVVRPLERHVPADRQPDIGERLRPAAPHAHLLDLDDPRHAHRP